MSTLLSVNDFISQVIPKITPIDIAARNKIIQVVDKYINGGNLVRILEESGITYGQFRHLIAKYPDFGANFEIIQAIHNDALEEIHTKNIDNAAELDWRAAAWRLKHLRPDKYGDKVEITNKKETVPVCVQNYVAGEIEDGRIVKD